MYKEWYVHAWLQIDRIIKMKCVIDVLCTTWIYLLVLINAKILLSFERPFAITEDWCLLTYYEVFGMTLVASYKCLYFCLASEGLSNSAVTMPSCVNRVRSCRDCCVVWGQLASALLQLVPYLCICKFIW